MKGKIIKGIAGFYYVLCKNEHDLQKEEQSTWNIYECKAKGIFRNKKIKPLVGDNVILNILDEEKKVGNIEEILPRTNSLIRPAVANIDQALVVFAITDPEPNLNLLDRFLIVMGMQQVPTIICFNKCDLVSEETEEKLKQLYNACGYEVHFISVYNNTGLDKIKQLLKNKTTVLAGPSGVGKSSLINYLKPDANMETGNISEKIKRGKHTTRHSEFFHLEEDSYILDTPGFSSIYIENIEEKDLKDYFPEFEQYECNCKFNGCVHVGETVCGIKEAVADGTIPKSRYENYCLLYKELKDKRKY